MTESHSFIDRRTLLKGAGALSAVMLQGGRVAAATPKRGGHIRLAMAGASTQDTFDPRRYKGPVMFLTNNSLRNTLTDVSIDNKVVAGLAESWESADGAKKWIFKLRKGVAFHSGKSLDAGDVVASIRLHQAADSTSPLKGLLSSIVSVESDGPNTVTFTLTGGNADFPAIFVTPYLPILPAKDGVANTTTVDGTGAYVLESFEPGVRIRLKRNANYWNAANGAYLDSAEILVVEDGAARMNALRSGAADIVNNVDIKVAALMQRAPNIRVEDVESGQHSVFAMQVDAAPFTNVDVRNALKYAINRQELIDKVLMGHGSLGNDTPICKFHKYFAKDIPQHQYDPDKAKFYLKRAGHDSITIALDVAEVAFQGAVDTGQLYAESARAAGININIVRQPDDGYFDKVWRKKPFSANFWGFRITENEIFSLTYAAGSPYNETHWENPRFNQLLVQSRAELDESKRADMYREMQLLVHDDGGSVIPVFTNHLWAVNKKVSHNEHVASNYQLDGLRCIERWWIEA